MDWQPADFLEATLGAYVLMGFTEPIKFFKRGCKPSTSIKSINFVIHGYKMMDVIVNVEFHRFQMNKKVLQNLLDLSFSLHGSLCRNGLHYWRLYAMKILSTSDACEV